MRREHQYWVYIATNGSKTLYTGVTNDLLRRMYEHRKSLVPGFTSKYRIDRLVYFETTPDIRAVIAREADQGLAQGEEDRPHREREPEVERPGHRVEVS